MSWQYIRNCTRMEINHELVLYDSNMFNAAVLVPPRSDNPWLHLLLKSHAPTRSNIVDVTSNRLNIRGHHVPYQAHVVRTQHGAW